MNFTIRIFLTTFLLLNGFLCIRAQETENTKLPGEPDDSGKKALVFLIAGQSNAGGVATFSPETNKKAGLQDKHPTNPGTTAIEVCIPTTKDAYPRSYIWEPLNGPFEPLAPGKNLQTCYLDPWRHGIELPMAMLLEKRYPGFDIYFVKHGPGGHNLYTQWAAKQGPDYKNFIEQYQGAMADLKKRYKKVNVLGLYWDQGESDQKQAMEYETNLRNLIYALREDTGNPQLQFFIREQGIFQHDKPDFKPIVEAQVKITKEDPGAHLLDLDLGSNELNFNAWAWSVGNGHLSSKAYLELSRRIMALTKKQGKEAGENQIPLTKEQLKELRKEWGPFVGPWQRYDKNPIIGLEDKETYSIQNGPQSVIHWEDKWYMFLMTSQPMVTKLAVSDDGLTWKRPHHNYLLKPEMDWEGSYNLAKAAVVRDDEVWLYYFGKKEKTEMIALARSKDMENWQKEPKPIFTHKDSRIEGTRAFPGCVIREGDTWFMYYNVGFDYHHPKNPDGYVIGVAASKDGINWIDSPKSPVLTTSERNADSWDDGMVSQCSVHKIGDWYYMLYSGSTNNYGRKYSGKNKMSFGLARARHPEGPWEKYPHNPVFTPTGNEEDFDGIYLQHACPVKVGDQWRLYYNGWTLNPNAKNKVSGGAEYAIGLAFTNDLKPVETKKKQTDKTAIVFLVAGQSNAGGCGVISPVVHKQLGRHKSRPLELGSTAPEVGLSTNAADYTHSYMWVPEQGFQRTNPKTNVRPTKMNENMHGMELPVIRELEKRYPENDIYVIKYGPGATTLHHDWNPKDQNVERPCYATWLGYYRNAMTQLSKEYREIRVAGLYWDQGESDGVDKMHGEYEKNLREFIAAVRHDTHLPQLKIFIRKHIFNWPNIDTIIAAQKKVVANDPNTFLLDIDIGDREENYKTWAYSPNNGHVSSKGFVELTKRLFDEPLKNATLKSFDKYESENPIGSNK